MCKWQAASDGTHFQRKSRTIGGLHCIQTEVAARRGWEVAATAAAAAATEAAWADPLLAVAHTVQPGDDCQAQALVRAADVGERAVVGGGRLDVGIGKAVGEGTIADYRHRAVVEGVGFGEVSKGWEDPEGVVLGWQAESGVLARQGSAVEGVGPWGPALEGVLLELDLELERWAKIVLHTSESKMASLAGVQ